MYQGVKSGPQARGAQVRLTRVADTGEVTYGVLSHAGVPFAVTLEEAWHENQHNISCIPVGVYACKRFHSAKHPNTFEVTGVPDRQAILFHVGNRDEDTLGCILVGEAFNPPGITQSKDGFAEFMRINEKTDVFTLEIVNAF